MPLVLDVGVVVIAAIIGGRQRTGWRAFLARTTVGRLVAFVGLRAFAHQAHHVAQSGTKQREVHHHEQHQGDRHLRQAMPGGDGGGWIDVRRRRRAPYELVPASSARGGYTEPGELPIVSDHGARSGEMIRWKMSADHTKEQRGQVLRTGKISSYYIKFQRHGRECSRVILLGSRVQEGTGGGNLPGFRERY